MLRLPASAGYPDLTDSQGVAGYTDHGNQRYVHLAAGEASFKLTAAPSPLPYLAEANGRVLAYARKGGTMELKLAGHMPLRFALANASGCRLQSDGRTLAAARQDGALSRYELNRNGTAALTLRCGG